MCKVSGHIRHFDGSKIEIFNLLPTWKSFYIRQLQHKYARWAWKRLNPKVNTRENCLLIMVEGSPVNNNQVSEKKNDWKFSKKSIFV